MIDAYFSSQKLATALGLNQKLLKEVKILFTPRQPALLQVTYYIDHDIMDTLTETVAEYRLVEKDRSL